PGLFRRPAPRARRASVLRAGDGRGADDRRRDTARVSGGASDTAGTRRYRVLSGRMTFPDSAGTRDFPDAAVPSPYPRSRWRGVSSLRRLPSASPLLALAGCVLFSAVLAFTALGTRPLVSPGESRYALIAREMVESGDWIQPRLNRVRYYEKP